MGFRSDSLEQHVFEWSSIKLFLAWCCFCVLTLIRLSNVTFWLKKSRRVQQHGRVLFDSPVCVVQESFTSHTYHDSKTALQRRAFIARFVNWLRIAKWFKTPFDGWGDSAIGDPWSLSPISLLFRSVLVCYRLEIGNCSEQRTQGWSQGSLYLLCICTFTFSVP